MQKIGVFWMDNKLDSMIHSFLQPIFKKTTMKAQQRWSALEVFARLLPSRLKTTAAMVNAEWRRSSLITFDQ